MPFPGVTSLVVPRGRLFPQVAAMLRKTGAPLRDEDADGRELAIEREGWRLLFARPRDVSLFVEHGVASLGVAGKDTLLEHPRPVVEALDLGIGACRLVIAVPAPVLAAACGSEEIPAPQPGGTVPAAAVSAALRSVRRVATKYPRLTEEYLAAKGIDAQVLVMHGAVESAPGLGLADAIIDLVQTGSTLRANGLSVAYTIVVSTARLIVNPVAYRLRSPALREWMEALRCLCA